ncbi:metallophosphoesterase family protein [Halomicrococcus gelatinilyticus]|uniref:metallophosphoesterase family protein n=1 Tax=Halomicrococcus gelatinilyticus TaxID=1702103 RepID=UPI002E0E3B04
MTEHLTKRERATVTEPERGSENDGRAAGHADAGPVLARFDRPRTATATTVAVVSDPHVSTEREGTWKVFHRTRERLRTVLADAMARDVDAVVLAGDLTEDGARIDFEAVDATLADAEVPTFAVPGNHDVRKAFDAHDGRPLSAFTANYASAGATGAAGGSSPSGLPFHARVGGVDVIGLNSASTPDGALDDTHDGAVSDDQLSWLDETLPGADAPVVVMHHNLPGLACGDLRSWRSSYPLRNADALVETLTGHGAPLVVSGHLHLPAVSCAGDVRQVVAPALSSFPQAALLLEVGPDGTTVRYVPVGGQAAVEEAYMHAQADSERSGMVADLVHARLSTLPLVDERASRRR